MTVQISPIFGAGAQRFVNTGPNGLVPNAAGLIYTYQGGTSTPQATYTDSTGATPQANPIVLDANGRVPNEIWLTSGQTYKFVEQDQFGNVLGTWDLIPGIASNNDIAAIQATLTGYAASFTTVALTVSGASSFNTASFSGATTFGGPINAGSNTLAIGAITSTAAWSAGGLTLSGTLVANLVTSGASSPLNLSSQGVAGSGAWQIDTNQTLLNLGNTQPSCFASLAANQTSGSVLICGTVAGAGGHNYRSGYGTGTGLFTAPVAGVYAFAATVPIASNTGSNASCNLALLLNSTQIITTTLNFIGSEGQVATLAAPAILLAAGQTLSVALVTGGTFTTFSGTQYAEAGASFSCRLQG